MLGLCSIAFAEELDPRWKWYSSTSYESEYFDTNTIEYDADSQIARVWTLNLNAEGRKIQAIKIQISYVTKKKETYFFITKKFYRNTKKRVLIKYSL